MALTASILPPSNSAHDSRRGPASWSGALYAALFATEGIGLWLGNAWAEWLTIVATASLIPFEVYEVFHKPRPVRIAILAANIAIVVCLTRLRRLESS